MKQSSLDDHDTLSMELESGLADGNGDDVVELSEFDERRPTDNEDNTQIFKNLSNRCGTPPPTSVPIPRGLPWKPKVRQKDIDFFLENARMKFVGYSLQGDNESLAGLPQPIHEGIKTLKEVSKSLLCDPFHLRLHMIYLCFQAYVHFNVRVTNTKGGRNSKNSFDGM